MKRRAAVDAGRCLVETKTEHEFGGPLFWRERGRTNLTELGQMIRANVAESVGPTHMDAVDQRIRDAEAFSRAAS